ncbi:hypothetical protein [Methylorubrum populi]|uniref:Uncharacterized protein n=1 Tax=Methylorubrum populi TaxID=223967 RepID=A0A921E2S3_9HYPH|nr:hypothetical protein [Methylorubrum populi]
MTPVSQCLRKVDHASTIAAPTAVEHLCAALNELESAYHRPSERIIALEAILHEFMRSGHMSNTPFGRFLRISIERRQNKWSLRYA